MRRIVVLFIGGMILLGGCAPKISLNISKSYPTLDYKEDVRVFGLEDTIPLASEEIGTVKIKGSSFSTNCGWDIMLDKAMLEARKVGGNAIKITAHKPPSFMGSQCHQIKATILKIENLDEIPTIAVDSALLNSDYAVLHIYRNSPIGAIINYDLYLGDSVICRVSNKWKKTIKIRKDGLNTLWAKTEAKKELPINIKIGNEYYIRCEIVMGILLGRPNLELVDNKTGRVEFQSNKLKATKSRDLVILTDGRQYDCIITNEDANSLYITIIKDNKEVKTILSKAIIQRIIRGE